MQCAWAICRLVLISVRLADNRRLCGRPDHLARRGDPAAPPRAGAARCLTLSSDASQIRGWAFSCCAPKATAMWFTSKPSGPWTAPTAKSQSTGAWTAAGIAKRSTWEVDADIAAGRLVPLLEAFAAPPNGIYMGVSQRKHAAARAAGLIFKMHYEPLNSGAKGKRMMFGICTGQPAPGGDFGDGGVLLQPSGAVRQEWLNAAVVPPAAPGLDFPGLGHRAAAIGRGPGGPGASKAGCRVCWPAAVSHQDDLGAHHPGGLWRGPVSPSAAGCARWTKAHCPATQDQPPAPRHHAAHPHHAVHRRGGRILGAGW